MAQEDRHSHHPDAAVRSVQRGRPDQHLKYMLEVGLRYAPPEGIAAAAEALLPWLGVSDCLLRDAGEDECRPGACDCDGAHDALAYAIGLYREGRQIR